MSDLGDPAGLSPSSGGFVGRERELDRVGALLMGPARLVTLIGSGGIGKTRLAEEAARRLHRARRTPVFVVRLAGLATGLDVAAVREAVAAAILVEGFAGASAWDGAVQRLSGLDGAGRVIQTVLMLDNCEHVLNAAGSVIAELLAAVPGLTVLATSREPVGWVDEQLLKVPPLSAAQSLELFRQRAELTGHLIADPGQVALAEQICRHMHGHPLYVRLAAARMFYEPLAMILEQLTGESGDVRLRWRQGPRAGSEDRHRAIGDVIAWSYELCTDKQRLLFDRLSVFAPGHDVNPQDPGVGVADVGAELEAIEMVCADDVPIDGCEGAPGAKRGDQTTVDLTRTEIRELLERLVEQSLVSVHVTADMVRFYLLESLRLFAADRLAERSTQNVDESALLARRHCYYYRNEVLQRQVEWFSSAEQDLLAWAIGAWPNIRRAIDTSMAVGNPDVGLQICVGAMSLRAPFLLGSLSEIRGRIVQALAAAQTSQSESTEIEVAAMAQIARLAVTQGRPEEESKELLDRCVAVCNVQAARDGAWRDGPEGDIGLPAVVDFAWGVELMLASRDPRSVAVLARAREKFQTVADRGGEVLSGIFEAMAAAFYGSAEQASMVGHRCLERTTTAGAQWAQSWAQMMLAIGLTKHGDANEALELGRAALAYQLPLGDQWGMTWAAHIRMWSLARLITDQRAAGNTSRTALVGLAGEIAYLAGGAKAQRARLGVLIENLGPFADETSAAEEVAREVLGEKAYVDVEKRGSRLFVERSELQRIALGGLSITTSSLDGPVAKGTSSWHSLSAAEQEVAVLAAAGWSNSAVGMRRGTSTRTVDAQIASIFQKLMINSREDIVRFVPPEQRGRVSAERSHIPRQSRGKPRAVP